MRQETVSRPGSWRRGGGAVALVGLSSASSRGSVMLSASPTRVDHGGGPQPMRSASGVAHCGRLQKQKLAPRTGHFIFQKEDSIILNPNLKIPTDSIFSLIQLYDQSNG